MAMNWPTFFTRLGSAIVFSIIMMAGLLWVDWALYLLLALIQVLCIREYFKLVHLITPDMYLPAWLPWATQAMALALFFSAILLPGKVLGIALVCVPLLVLATSLSKQTAWQAGLHAIGGLCYILFPMLSMAMLRHIDFSLPTALILMIWMNDTMAYIVGSFIGKTPFSAISPKKTWEGTAGGAVLTIAGGAIWGYYAHRAHFMMVDWMMISAIVAIAGTAGDLFESKLKRLAGVKDSGAMMPGHGGALDRFDSLLISAPFVLAYIWLFVPIVE